MVLISGLVLGVVLGFVFQRGRFCVTGAFRDVWLSGSTRWLTAFGLAIAVQAVLVQGMLGLGLIQASVTPIAWVGVAAGSFLFGIGIVLAGGCATGTYYRSGEGLIGSWIALVFYAGFAAITKYGAGKPLNDAVVASRSDATTIHGSLGISVWFLVAALIAAVAWGLSRQRNQRVAVVGQARRRNGIAHILFEKPWNPNTTAVIVGVIAALAYPFANAAGRKSGLGITTPSANIVDYLVTGNVERIDWGVLFVLGLIPGSYIAAKLAGEFRLRAPDARTAVRAITGGTAMGVGAAIAGGCTIGNSLVQTALFSYQGWVAFLFTFLGVGLAARLFIQTHRRAGAAPVLVEQPASVNA